MFGQTFAPSDLAGVAALVLLEGLLSADNALVLAIMVKHLKKDDQQRALLYGLGGAFVFRFLMIVFATLILKQWWLQALGGAYLLYLPIKHFFTKGSKEEAEDESKYAGKGFWPTVIAVE
ncbi:tellurium resistance protein TerC, partial [bacterium]